MPRHARRGALQLQSDLDDVDRDLHDGGHHTACHAGKHGMGGGEWLPGAVAHPPACGAKGVKGDGVLQRDGGEGVGHAFEKGAGAFVRDGVFPHLQSAFVGGVWLLETDADGVEGLASEHACNTTKRAYAMVCVQVTSCAAACLPRNPWCPG